MDKIDVKGSDNNYLSNLCVYDCSLELADISVESIEKALQLIDIAINRLSFRLNGEFEWFLKYPYMDHSSGVAQIRENDLETLSNYITGFNSEDSDLFDTAISWYINGNKAENIFTKFLSYYIALEGLALRFITGKMSISEQYGIEKTPKKKRQKVTNDCIIKKHDDLYKKDPSKFIREAYGECILSNRVKTEKALKKVFGKTHKYVKEFSKKLNGNSLYDLRCKLAHGSFALIDPEHRDAIKNRLYILQTITHDFIIRLFTGIEAGEKYEKVDRNFSLTLAFNDPRSTGVVSNLNRLMPNKDWKIKLEWLL